MKVLYFDDNADGEAYLAGVDDDVNNQYRLMRAIERATEHDHVCLVSNKDYYEKGDATFSEYAPVALTVEIGDGFDISKIR